MNSKNKALLLTIAGFFSLCSCNQVQKKQVENDTNTPLHLLKPVYDSPYGIPSQEEVKEVMDRVLHFLIAAMPPQTDDEGRIAKGQLRLTSYECGVIYAAMLEAGRVTGDTEYTCFTEDRLTFLANLVSQIKEKVLENPSFDSQMRQVVSPKALDDSGAMSSAFIQMVLENPELSTSFNSVIDNYVDYVMNHEYRLPGNGMFARNRPHLNSVWLDDMYMGVPCLAWYGKYKNDTKYFDEAIRQIKCFKDIMWVEEHQLFRHAWVESMNPHLTFHWGRANGWALLTMCEVLDALPEDYPERSFVMELFRSHVAGLSALQDKTGFWHQLLDQPDTYLETSCTAIYTYCMAHAICKGWIDAKAYGAQVLQAWNAVTTKVTEAGEVEGTCVGTGMGFDKAFYAYRPTHLMAAHGYGPTIWAGAEIIRLLKMTHPKMNDTAVHFYDTEQKTNKAIFSENVPD